MHGLAVVIAVVSLQRQFPVTVVEPDIFGTVIHKFQADTFFRHASDAVAAQCRLCLPAFILRHDFLRIYAVHLAFPVRHVYEAAGHSTAGEYHITYSAPGILDNNHRAVIFIGNRRYHFVDDMMVRHAVPLVRHVLEADAVDGCGVFQRLTVGKLHLFGIVGTCQRKGLLHLLVVICKVEFLQKGRLLFR